MYKELFNKKALYITYVCKYKGRDRCIINIGDKYKLYIDTKVNINSKRIKYISMYIAMLICDFIVINKIKNIDESIFELDIALDLGKDIYAIPGDIFEYENYLANFGIKHGAVPVCSKYDMEYVLKEKTLNVL